MKGVTRQTTTHDTGNDVSSTKELETLANSIGDAILVVDEAYVDFSDRASTASLISKCPNVCVLQTFSKSWGLAGVRCGVCMAHEDIVDYLTKMKAPYNLNKMTSKVARNAMSHIDELMKNIKLIISERNRRFGTLGSSFFFFKISQRPAFFSHKI